jgi:hypothetical protein
MTETPTTKLQGIIEIDETYVGGKVKGRGVKAGKDNKTPVVSLVRIPGQGDRDSEDIPIKIPKLI